MCFTVKGKCYTDISLPFGLWWAAASCQNTTGLVARHLQGQGASILRYTDDFGGVTSSEAHAPEYFTQLGNLLKCLGFAEAEHNASPPAQQMAWLGLHFDMVTMRITIPTVKMAEVLLLV